MRIDRAYHAFILAEYLAGTIIAKLLLQRVGPQSRVHCSVRYWSPSKIQIGSGCEIRHGTFLDARSERETSIWIGDHTRIKDFVGIATYGGEVQLGNNVLVGRCSTIFGHGGVFIGAHSMLGQHVLIVSSTYPAYMDEVAFQDQGFTREEIKIGENVWIGSHACVLAGSRVEANTVVAAGSFVHGYLAGGWVYGGIPARKLKPIEKSRAQRTRTYTRDWGLID